jgi:hypothetical protein
MVIHRVTTPVAVENYLDRYAVEHGCRSIEAVRRITFETAVVDPDYALLTLSKAMIRELGLSKSLGCRAGEYQFYGPVRLTILGRTCTTNVPDAGDQDAPILLGRLPLLQLDLVVDRRSQKLIGNPAHGGEDIIEMF